MVRGGGGFRWVGVGWTNREATAGVVEPKGGGFEGAAEGEEGE